MKLPPLAGNTETKKAKLCLVGKIMGKRTVLVLKVVPATIYEDRNGKFVFICHLALD